MELLRKFALKLYLKDKSYSKIFADIIIAYLKKNDSLMKGCDPREKLYVADIPGIPCKTVCNLIRHTSEDNLLKVVTYIETTLK